MRKEIMMPGTKVVVLDAFFKKLSKSLNSGFTLTSCIDSIDSAKVTTSGIIYTLRDTTGKYSPDGVCDVDNFNEFIGDVKAKLSTIKLNR